MGQSIKKCPVHSLTYRSLINVGCIKRLKLSEDVLGIVYYPEVVSSMWIILFSSFYEVVSIYFVIFILGLFISFKNNWWSPCSPHNYVGYLSPVSRLVTLWGAQDSPGKGNSEGAGWNLGTFQGWRETRIYVLNMIRHCLFFSLYLSPPLPLYCCKS